MQNNKNLIWLGLVLVALGGLYFASSQKRTNFDEQGGFEPLLGEFTAEQIHGIRAWTGDAQADALELVRRGEDWFLTNRFDAPANENKILAFFGALESANAEFRSDDASVLDDYQLGEEQAVHLVLRGEGGDERLHLLLGKRSGNGNFIRRSDSSRAQLSDHNFLSDFGVFGEELGGPNILSFLELTAFKSAKDSVERVELIWPEGRLEMAKEWPQPDPADTNANAAVVRGYEWRVNAPASFQAIKSKADARVASLAAIRANDVLHRGEADAAWNLGLATARISYASGRELAVEFGAAPEGDENARYFRVVGEDLIWKVPNYLYDNLFKEAGELRPDQG